MDTILQFLTGVLRYVLPVLALLILAVCVISLFRNRPGCTRWPSWWTKITAP